MRKLRAQAADRFDRRWRIEGELDSTDACIDQYIRNFDDLSRTYATQNGNDRGDIFLPAERHRISFIPPPAHVTPPTYRHCRPTGATQCRAIRGLARRRSPAKVRRSGSPSQLE